MVSWGKRWRNTKCNSYDPKIRERKKNKANSSYIKYIELFKGFIQLHLAQFRAHGSLRQLGHGKRIIIDTIGRLVRIKHPKIQHPIHRERDVVFGNSALTGHIYRLLLERAVSRYTVDKGDKKIETCLLYTFEFTKPFNDIGSIMRNEFNRIPQDNKDQNEKPDCRTENES